MYYVCLMFFKLETLQLDEVLFGSVFIFFAKESRFIIFLFIYMGSYVHICI